MSFDSNQVCVFNPCGDNVNAKCLSLETVYIDPSDSPFTPSGDVVIFANAEDGEDIDINLVNPDDCDHPTFYIKLDAGEGEEIPTLEDVLQLLKDKIMLNIELKGLGTAKSVYELVKKTGWRNEKLTVTSFNWDMLGEYKALDSEARIGVLTFKNHDEALRYAEAIKAYSINPYHMLLQKKYVEEAHEKGIKIYPWTPNKPEDIQNVVKKGVDGVISDYPDRILHQK